MIAPRKACRSKTERAAMVVPPGEVTMSLSSAGCFPVSRSILAAPSKVCAANFKATSLGNPKLTPASARASAKTKTYAGPLPESAVTASINFSGTSTTNPTALKISWAIFRWFSSSVRPKRNCACPSQDLCGRVRHNANDGRSLRQRCLYAGNWNARSD
jgi:hypothetical protein